jgi:hypothetical protein
MARASRHHIPGQVWHIPHHCHKRDFLLKFAKDHGRWLRWLFDRRFSRSTLRHHLGCLSHFNRYLGGLDQAPQRVVSRQDLDGFWQVYPSQCRHRSPLAAHLYTVGWAISRFIAYLREPGAFWEPPCALPLYQPLPDEYGVAF